MGGLAPGSRGLAPASMGPRRVPRKWSLLVAPISVSHRLQWGRGVCLGNGILTQGGEIDAYLLQWGRGVCLGNGPDASTARRKAALLQWGRGVCLGNGWMWSNCKRPSPTLQWGRGVCLGNGRGPRRVPRKWAKSLVVVLPGTLLQWGRGVCLGNGFRDRWPAPHPRRASMGPRRVPRKWGAGGHQLNLDGRASMGPRRVPRKWGLTDVLPYLFRWLQWGRGVCLGNGNRESWRALPPMSFNGAEACASEAEACASEMACLMAKSLHQIRSFNGAEACASEMASASGRNTPTAMRFNGAEACASEMVLPIDGQFHVVGGASMGPRRVPRKWVVRVVERGQDHDASMGPRRVPRKWTPPKRDCPPTVS
ncbi:MAG: hypothetical protein JG774_1817 [Desulfomicrobiaceae bacterium]|nr:hypothetical protein [Desulfomicrobiaceae bacterium]